jgi:hypothetical protein
MGGGAPWRVKIGLPPVVREETQHRAAAGRLLLLRLPHRMSLSTDSSTPVDYLLREVARLGEKNKRLTRQVRELRQSRDEWRAKARTRARRPLPLAPDDPRHGTLNGYANLGCRCDQCRAANTDYCRAYQHRAGRHKPYAEWLASVEGCHVPHGTETRYTQGGCRCEDCKRAASTARNRRRYETPEKAERQRAYDRERKRKRRPSLP